MTPTAAELEARMAARRPGATGAGRASTDETHRLVLCHPRYDGFVTLEVTAHVDLDGVFVVPDPALVDQVTAHHRTGPLERGQTLPIDLELHPGKVREPVSAGLLELVDVEGEPIAPAVGLTLATHASLDCVIAGAADGPYADAAEFEVAVADLAGGRVRTRRLARRIERMARQR